MSLDSTRCSTTSCTRTAAEALKSAEEALPLLEETGYFLRSYKDDIAFSLERLEMVQERLELIKGLKKKRRGFIFFQG